MHGDPPGVEPQPMVQPHTMQQTHASDVADQDAHSRPIGTAGQQAVPLEVWLRVSDVSRTGNVRHSRWGAGGRATAPSSRQRRNQAVALAAAAVLAAVTYWLLPIGGDRAAHPERRPPPDWSTQQLPWRSPDVATPQPETPPTRAAQSPPGDATASETTLDASARAEESTASPPAPVWSDDTSREVLSGSADPSGPRLPAPARAVSSEPVTLLGIERAGRSARHERSGPY